MRMRWFVIEVSDEYMDCPIVGNCETKELAENVIATLTEHTDRVFKTVGPITENMIQGKFTTKDIDIIEAQMEQLEHVHGGGRLH